LKRKHNFGQFARYAFALQLMISSYGNIRFVSISIRSKEMDTGFRHMKRMLTAILFFAAVLLAGCGSGCKTLGGPDVPGCGIGIYSISGGVSGTVLQGVRINLTGTATANSTTDASGKYSFEALVNGSYTMVPSLAGYTFSPASNAVTISGVNVTGINFSETANASASSSLSGTVSGAVSQNVTITLSGANTGSTVTDASGNFSFSGLVAGSYTVTPSLAGYTFSPASNTVTTISGGNVAVSNFTSAL
jgi:hypothetical protein